MQVEKAVWPSRAPLGLPSSPLLQQPAGSMVATRSQTSATAAKPNELATAAQPNELATAAQPNKLATAAGDLLHHDDYILILSQLPPGSAKIFARCAQVCRAFGAAGGIVESALRMRATQPPELPKTFGSWLQKLVWDERRAGVHAPGLSVGLSHGAAVHAGRCFVWGTEYVSFAGREVIGMLGVGLRNQTGHVFGGDIRTPTPLANVDNAVSVSCGREHTLVLSSDGRVFAFGNGEWGQCGTAKGRPKNDTFPPHAEPARLRGKNVFTDTSTFGKLKDGYWPIDTLYSIENDTPFAHCAQCVGCPHPPSQISGVGMSDNFSEDGHPYGPFGMIPPAFVVPVPRRLSAPVKVLKVSAGSLHSLLLCEDGYAYAFGCAYGGRLGLGPPADPPEHLVEPARLELGALSGGVRVIDISAGDQHSLAVIEGGRVATWGQGMLDG